MKRQLIYLILFGLLLNAGPLNAQHEQLLPARIQNGKFILTVNLSWDKQQQHEFARQYDFDTLLLRRVFEKDWKFVNDSSEWKTKLVGQDLVELASALGSEPEEPDSPSLAEIILSEIFSKGAFVAKPEKARFGTNKMRSSRAFSYAKNEACFFLPGYKNAKRIMLSGTFNNWSTLQNPMQQTDSGWRLCLPLIPGKYSYKYIVDGRWMTDPNNDLREDNDQGTENSIVFCYNHRFFLKAYPNAKKVFVAGSFNDWDGNQLQMKKTDGGWALRLYLQEGTHAYKFIVDGNWVTDPSNPDVRPDGNGNLNTFIGIGDTVLFILDDHAEAREVYLTGSFNAWKERELGMKKNGKQWELKYVLGAGNYQYKYIVDGKWTIDPKNPYTVGTNDYVNSFLAFKPNQVFHLNGHAAAKEVIVTGSFNGWRTDGYRMKKTTTGWIFPVFLDPGRYTYKFRVEGEWITDPDNKLYEENEYGTGNSVIWIEP